MRYDESLKREHLSPIFRELESQNKIGNVVIDVGSGAYSVAEFLPGVHKLITLDIAGKERQSRRQRHVTVDVEQASSESTLSHKKALVKIAEFLGIDPCQEANKQQVDSLIFSEILNYVDYQKILRSFEAYLKPGGRLIIVNMPDRGFKYLFAEKGLRSNEDLYKFLIQEGFEIESKHFPWR